MRLRPYPELMQGRVYSPKSESYRIGGWTLCVRTNSLTRAGEQVELESRLVFLLAALADRRGEVLSKDWLLQTLWQGKTVTDESLSVAVSRLRKALGDDTRRPSYIKTVPGAGYQLIAETGPEVMARQSAFPWRRVGVGAALCAAIAAIWFVTQPDIAPADRLAKTQKQIAAGDASSLKAAIHDLRALAADTPTAPAFTLLAEAKMRLMGDALAEPDNCAEVVGLLDRAIALDARHAPAFVLRGDARFQCRRDATGAEGDYRTALRLNPGNDQAALGYSGLLLAQGRFDESQAQIEAARRANPLNYSAPMVVWLYQMQDRDDLALKELERMEKAGADDRWFHISATRVHARAGREAQSFAHLKWLMQDAGFTAADLAAAQTTFDAAGLKGVNAWLLRRKDEADLGQYTPPLSWARYALAAGETEQAATYLEQAAERRQSPLLWAGVDPAYAPLRNDPRFSALLAKPGP